MTLRPDAPILSLIVIPKEKNNLRDMLARFHPVMKSLGFGRFELDDDGLYQASKPGKGFLGSDLYVFAEAQEDRLIINVDGHSVFELKDVQKQLEQMREAYMQREGCEAHVHGPDVGSAVKSNLLYTLLPIYVSAALVYIIFRLSGAGDAGPSPLMLFFYATLGGTATRTRFWIGQRRKRRPVWRGVLTLLLTVPIILGILILVGYGISKLS